MEAEISEPIRFRPTKRRKTYRQRHDDQDEDHAETNDRSQESPPPSQQSQLQSQSRATAADYFGQDGEADGHEDSAGEALPAVVRARSAHKARFRGVGFRAGSKPGETDPTEQTAVMLRESQQDESAGVVVSGITDRFTHQTGFVGDVNDRHMLVLSFLSLSSLPLSHLVIFPRSLCAYSEDCVKVMPVANHPRNNYIESRLSSRPEAPGQETRQPQERDPSSPTDTMVSGGNAPIPQQPAMHGNLMEVDLPPTDAAAKGHRAGSNGMQTSSRAPGGGRGGGVQKKQRLGPDGKPWRSRNRRGSDDVKRDQLVEQFLHENRRKYSRDSRNSSMSSSISGGLES